jgi:uncharacterized protein (DUF433 family)
MTDFVRLYTPAEAAAVSGLALKAVNNAIDKRIVDVAMPPAMGKRAARRYLTRYHLLCFRLEHGLSGRLPLDRRQSLYREFAAKPDVKLLKADDLLLVDVGAARREVSARVRDLEEAERLIQVDDETLGGEPVFKGTRIPVYLIAAMMHQGAETDEVLSGYESLDRRKLDLARLWAAAHPRRGRPKRLADFGFTLKSTRRRKLPRDPFEETSTAELGDT